MRIAKKRLLLSNLGDETVETVVPRDPDAPLALVAENIIPGPGEPPALRVYWTPPADSGGSPLRQFIVKRKIANSGQSMDELARIDAPTTQYVDIAISPGTSYAFRVAAINGFGLIGPDSNKATVTAGSYGPDTQPPEWPVGAAITVDLLTSFGVQMSWPDAQDNVGVDRYVVSKRDTGDVDWIEVATQDVDTPSWGDGTLSPNESNDYQVIAYDAAGNASDPLEITIVAPPDTEDPYWPNDDPFLIAIPVGTDALHADWADASDNVGVVRYRVRLDGITVTTTLSPSEYDFTGLTPGQTYTIGIKAYDAADNASAEFTIMAMVPASEPPQRIFRLLDEEPWLAQQYYPANPHCPLDPRLYEYQPEISHEVGRFIRKHNGVSPELPNKLIFPSGPEVHALHPDFDASLNPQIVSEHVIMVGWHAENGRVQNVIIDGGGDWVTSRDATKAKNKAVQQSIHTGCVIRSYLSGRTLARSTEEQAEFVGCWPRKRAHFDSRHADHVTVRHFEVWGPNVAGNHEYGNCSPKPPPDDADPYGVCNGEVIYPRYHPARSGGGASDPSYPVPGYTRFAAVGELEEQHGFNIGPNCDYITVEDCEFHHVFGDGVEFFGEFAPGRHHLVQRVNVHNTGRMGAGMTCALSCTLRDSDFDEVPRGMIDFEPPGGFPIQDVEVSGNRFHFNLLRTIAMGGGRGVLSDGSLAMDDVRILDNWCFGRPLSIQSSYDAHAPSWSVSAQTAYKIARGKITITGNRSIARVSVSGGLPPITLHKYLGVTILDNYLPFNLCSGNVKCGTFATLTACQAYNQAGDLVDVFNPSDVIRDEVLWDANADAASPGYQSDAGLRAARQGSLGSRMPDPTTGGGQSAGYGNPCFGTLSTQQAWDKPSNKLRNGKQNYMPCASKAYSGTQNPPPPSG